MRLPSPVSLSQLSDLGLQFKAYGPAAEITGVALLPFVRDDDAVFVDSSRWIRAAIDSVAPIVVTTEDHYKTQGSSSSSNRKTIVTCQSPFLLLRHALALSGARLQFADERYVVDSADPAADSRRWGAWIDPQAIVGCGTAVHPGAFIGADVIIGQGCVIGEGAKILPSSRLGQGVVVGANSTIGNDPFYYQRDVLGRPVRFPAAGGVVVADFVQLGAGVCVDRGVLEDTIIGEYTVIDNLVQVGHGATIGKNVIIAGQTGLAGNVRIGDGVRLEGQVGISPNVSIVAGTIIHGRGATATDITRPGEYTGIRARTVKDEVNRESAIRLIANYASEFRKLAKPPQGTTDERLLTVVANALGRDAATIGLDTSLRRELGLDSLDLLKIWMDVEEEFGIIVPDDRRVFVETLRDAAKEILRHVIVTPRSGFDRTGPR
jgi:UDP-3-O-[3-hydroxymyristoyl] glucosamine N-acyltransferase